MVLQISKWRRFGTSLAIQWLGHRAFTDGAWVQSLVRELRSHKPRRHGAGGEEAISMI